MTIVREELHKIGSLTQQEKENFNPVGKELFGKPNPFYVTTGLLYVSMNIYKQPPTWKDSDTSLLTFINNFLSNHKYILWDINNLETEKDIASRKRIVNELMRLLMDTQPVVKCLNQIYYNTVGHTDITGFEKETLILTSLMQIRDFGLTKYYPYSYLFMHQILPDGKLRFYKPHESINLLLQAFIRHIIEVFQGAVRNQVSIDYESGFYSIFHAIYNIVMIHDILFKDAYIKLLKEYYCKEKDEDCTEDNITYEDLIGMLKEWKQYPQRMRPLLLNLPILSDE